MNELLWSKEINDKILNIYVDKFNESFPYFIVRRMSDEEMSKTMVKALIEEKPFEPEIDTNV